MRAMFFVTRDHTVVVW